MSPWKAQLQGLPLGHPPWARPRDPPYCCGPPPPQGHTCATCTRSPDPSAGRSTCILRGKMPSPEKLRPRVGLGQACGGRGMGALSPIPRTHPKEGGFPLCRRQAEGLLSLPCTVWVGQEGWAGCPRFPEGDPQHSQNVRPHGPVSAATCP